MDFELAVRKFGDPLLELTSTATNCCCLIDRAHKRIYLAVADAKFPSLKEETKMLWLREFGVVSDALNPSFKFPQSVDEICASIAPADQFTYPKITKIIFDSQLPRENIAWFSRALWQLLEEDRVSEEEKAKFQMEWRNFQNEEFKAPLKDFLNRPRIVNQT